MFSGFNVREQNLPLPVIDQNTPAISPTRMYWYNLVNAGTPLELLCPNGYQLVIDGMLLWLTAGGQYGNRNIEISIYDESHASNPVYVTNTAQCGRYQSIMCNLSATETNYDVICNTTLGGTVTMSHRHIPAVLQQGWELYITIETESPTDVIMTSGYYYLQRI